MYLVNGSDTRKRYPLSVKEMAMQLAYLEYDNGYYNTYCHHINIEEGDTQEDIQFVFNILNKMGLATNEGNGDEDIFCSLYDWDTEEDRKGIYHKVISYLAELNMTDKEYYEWCSHIKENIWNPDFGY